MHGEPAVGATAVLEYVVDRREKGEVKQLEHDEERWNWRIEGREE